MQATFTSNKLKAAVLAESLRAAGFEVDAPVDDERTVLDTYEGALHTAGLRLELRRAAGSPTVLVLSGGPGVPPAELPVADAPRFAHTVAPGPFRNRLVAVTGERTLLPVVTLTSSRRRAVRRDERGKITVTLAIHDRPGARDGISDLAPADHGAPVGRARPKAAKPAKLPKRVVEVAFSAGHADEFDHTLDLLSALGLRRAGHDLVELAASAAGGDLGGREASPTVPMSADEPAFDAYRRVLANLAATVEANRWGTIGDLDIEFLHELRVAVRRTRAVLAQARDVVPDDVRDAYRETFAWLGTETGPARDLDVYLVGWRDYVAPIPPDARAALAPVRTLLESRRQAAHAALAGVLRSERYRSALAGWQDRLHDPAAERGPAGAAPVGALVAARIAKAQRRLLQHGRTITDDSPAERLHDLRKDAKKLRYLLECFGGLLEPGARKAFVKRLKALQDNLGEHQDAEVHVAQLRSLAFDLDHTDGIDAGTLLAMGQLTAHLEGRRLDERRRFAARFAAYDTDATADTLAELLAGGH